MSSTRTAVSEPTPKDIVQNAADLAKKAREEGKELIAKAKEVPMPDNSSFHAPSFGLGIALAASVMLSFLIVRGVGRLFLRLLVMAILCGLVTGGYFLFARGS